MLDRLRAYALGFPETYEDTPWGDEVVSKVGPKGKIFVFYGSDSSPSISVKLPESCDQALAAPGATPTGYGLGRHGWVSLPVTGRGAPAPEVLEDWIEESYRANAPKKLVKLLDA